MNSIRLALGLLAVCLAMPAAAGLTPTPTSFSFGTQASVVGTNAWSNSSATKYNPTDGTNYGNMRTFMSLGVSPVPVGVTAWGSTGGVGGFDGTLQSAYVARYGPGSNELAVTSRPVSGNAELNARHNPASPQHAMDNNGAYESLLFSFQSSVTLDTVSIGYPSSGSGLDSDATVLVYTGSGDPTPNLSVRTYADLLTNGWQIAGNLFNMSTSSPKTVPTTSTSKYWMVGAFMNIGGNKMITHDNTFDYIKINGITVTPRLAVPEPDSLALLAIASLGLLYRRRKGAPGV